MNIEKVQKNKKNKKKNKNQNTEDIDSLLKTSPNLKQKEGNIMVYKYATPQSCIWLSECMTRK